MRLLGLAPLVVVASLAGAAPAGGGVIHVPRVAAGAGISVRVPPGWGLIRRRLTDVGDPAQRLAVASFPVRLAARRCACGKANIRNFPRDGAFVFVWEYLRPEEMSVPRRPAAFHVGRPRAYDCARPTTMTVFRAAGRIFQVEVFLGPAATPGMRARVDALLDSLRVAQPRR